MNENFLKNKNYPYLLGFLFADGSIIQNKRGAWYLSLQVKDRSVIDMTKKIFNVKNKIEKRIDRRYGTKLYRIQIGSKYFCQKLVEAGLKKGKTKRMRIPNISPSFLSEFVRGYFDGDGNVWSGYTKAKRPVPIVITSFTSSSKLFLKDLQEKLRQQDIGPGSLFERKGYSRLNYATKDSLKLYAFMYNAGNSPPFLKRKRIVFEKHLMRP
jgi:intein/homing endonuclease